MEQSGTQQLPAVGGDSMTHAALPPHRAPTAPNVIPDDLWEELYGTVASSSAMRRMPLSNLAAARERERGAVVEGVTLLVKNIPASCQENDLRMLFPERCGLVHVRLVKEVDSPHCVGYGFLDFHSHAAAKSALGKYQGVQLPGRAIPLLLEWTKTSAGVPTDGYQMYVGNLSLDVTDGELLAFAKKFSSAALSAKVIFDFVERQSRGYGFVRFRFDEDAKLALKRMAREGASLGDHRLTVKIVDRKPSDSSGMDGNSPTVVFVANVSDLVTEEDLKRVFSPFGSVSSIRILQVKHIAFVTFAEHVCALASIAHLGGHPLKGQKLAVAWGRSRFDLPFHVRIQSATDQQDLMAEKLHNVEWHQAMMPQPQPKRQKVEEKKDDAAATDTAYWLSCLAGLAAPGADNNSPASAAPREAPETTSAVPTSESSIPTETSDAKNKDLQTQRGEGTDTQDKGGEEESNQPAVS